MVRVARVAAGSIAEEIGFAAGTELLSVNGRALSDFLDWEFLTADDELVIERDRVIPAELHPPARIARV